jgi:hypothetical protein
VGGRHLPLDDLNTARFLWQSRYIDANAWPSGTTGRGVVLRAVGRAVPLPVGTRALRQLTWCDAVWLPGDRAWFAYFTASDPGYPKFAIPFAILIGLVMSEVPEWEGSNCVRTTLTQAPRRWETPV